MTAARRQLPLFRRHPGGRPKKKDAGVSHGPRPQHARRFPMHVSLRMRDDVWNLRSHRMFRAVRRAVPVARDRFGMRLVHYSVQGNHVHLIVEAQDRAAVSRAMQGLGIRVAKALNRAMGRRGAVFGDRYFARELRTPREVRHALVYVLNNALKHFGPRAGWLDACSSAWHFDGWVSALPRTPPREAGPPGAPPGTWLLAAGWRRHGLIRFDEVPGS